MRTWIEEDGQEELQNHRTLDQTDLSDLQEQSVVWAASHSLIGGWPDGFPWKWPQTLLQVPSLGLAHPDKCPLSFVSEGWQREPKDSQWQNSWCISLQNWRRSYLATELEF